MTIPPDPLSASALPDPDPGAAALLRIYQDLSGCERAMLLRREAGGLRVAAALGAGELGAGQRLDAPPWDGGDGAAWGFERIADGAMELGWIGGRPAGDLGNRKADLVELARLVLRGPGEEVVRQLTRFSILAEIGRAVAAKLELESLMTTVYKEVGRLFDTTNFYIALHRAGESEWSWDFHVERGRREAPTRHPVGSGLTGHILATGRALRFTGKDEKQRFREAFGLGFLGEPARSWMGVPLATGDSVVGVMAIQDYERDGVYTQEDLELFQAIAAQIAVAVRNAQLYGDSERRFRELEALAAMERDISSSLDLETVLGRIVSNVRTLLTKDSMAIFLEDPRQQGFRAAAASGPMEASLQQTILQRGQGILGSVIERGLPELVLDTDQDPRRVHIAGTEENEQGEKLMAAPLRVEDRVIGVIAAWRKADEAPFELADLIFLDGVGRQASVAIRNAQLFGQAKTAQAEAESANRAKSSFLASMSHELRTPLNAILLYSELLIDEVRDRGSLELMGDLDKIQSAGRHLLGLIDDVLDLSKIEAGRMSVLLEDCDLQALLAEVADTVQPLVMRNRNGLLVEADPRMRILHTDQKKLRQTLYNLLSNAAKFTQDGTIRMKVEADAEDPRRARFTIADTGIGMNAEQLSRIFLEFSQAEEHTYRKFGGTGLGLTLSRKFVELLGGDIRVESEPGQGTRFTIRIPGLPAAAAAEARGTVLVIDDDESLREALTRMLVREGFQVLTAGSGEEGLARVQERRPSVITLDIAMPGLDGWQVLARLKADPELKRIPVVVLTVMDDRAKGIALEAADYLQKPVHRDQLLSTLARLLPQDEPDPILVVDDDEATREGLQRILALEKLESLGASNGLKAMELLGRRQPRLILLDLMMPEMDGFQLLEELEARPAWRQIPVVVLTAAELSPRQRERLCQPQIHQILRKGAYSRHELVDVVRRFAVRSVSAP